MSSKELEAARTTASQHPVAIVLPQDHEAWLELAALSGAVALFREPLPHSDDEIALAANALAEGKMYVSPSLAAPIVLAWRRSAYRERLLAMLTEREQAVMQLLVQGRSNHQIASALYLSPHTVRNHLSRIFAKLDVDRREQACEVWRAANESAAHDGGQSD